MSGRRYGKGGEHGGPRVRLVQAPVVGEVADRAHAQRLRALPHQLANGIGLRDARAKDVRRQPPLGQVVEALEVLAARDDHPAVEEHRLQGRLHLRPAPPRTGALVRLVLDLRRRQRPLRRKLAEQEVGHPGVGAIPGLRLADARALVVAEPLPQRPGLHRDERRLVRPVLDVRRPPGEQEPVELRLVVRSQPGEEREVVAALEHVHGVDLQHGEALQGEVQLARADGAGGAPEALRREGDAAGLGGGDIHAPDSTERDRQREFASRSPCGHRAYPGAP